MSDKTKTYPNIRTLLRKPRAAGDVGLEIECEGNHFRKDNEQLPPGWVYTADGSLRGEDSAEYVLKRPILSGDVEEALNSLWTMFDEDGTELDVSNRTSVHVHVNAQEMYVDQVCSFSALFIILEDLLTRWCGSHRIGNLFCLRSSDAEGIMVRLKEFFQDPDRYEFPSGMHYAGLNLSSLHKFGSIEVRTMRGAVDSADILTWVNVLMRLRDIAVGTTDPREIVEGFSTRGYQTFLQDCLGPYTNQILSEVLEEYPSFDTHSSVYQGVRRAQGLAYCRDWDLVRRQDVAKNPFKRNA